MSGLIRGQTALKKKLSNTPETKSSVTCCSAGRDDHDLVFY